MKKVIKAGQVLTAKSVCDSNCIFTAKVIDRKGDMLTLKVDGQVIRKKAKVDYEGNEYVLALGSYSMAPMFR